MKKFLVLVLLFSLLFFQKNIADSKADSLFAGNDYYNSEDDNTFIISSLDSLLFLYYSKYNNFSFDTALLNVYDFKIDDIPKYSDSVYAGRLSKLSSLIPLNYNQNVRNFIEVYTLMKREQSSRMLGLAQWYFPMFERILDQYNMPLELKNLAIVESALNPVAVSRAGATGIWQIMYNTGKAYGLNINSYIDERRDPYKSTVAAVRFLKELYNIYGDWLLAIAAYNCGPGNVNKAIRRSGGETNFWKIKPYLPKETGGYVPAFIAANYIINYYTEHNLYPIKPAFDYINIDTVLINKELSLLRISEVLNISIEELKILNPSVKKGVIPSSDISFALSLPYDKIIYFEQMKDSLYSNSMLTIDADSVIKQTYVEKIYINDKVYNENACAKLIYTVKTGDNLGHISMWYDCKVEDLKNWNNLTTNTLSIGRKLYIYVPKENSELFTTIENLSSEQKQSLLKNDNRNSLADNDPKKNYVYYQVKPGDTLWYITQLYSGVTVETLRKLNKLTNINKLKPGMLLIIGETG